MYDANLALAVYLFIAVTMSFVFIMIAGENTKRDAVGIFIASVFWLPFIFALMIYGALGGFGDKRWK